MIDFGGVFDYDGDTVTTDIEIEPKVDFIRFNDDLG